MKREVPTPQPMPRLVYQADPIRESIRILGAKWTLLILRDIAFLKLDRFGKILRNNPGLTPRVLSRRLKNMREEGLVKRVMIREVVTYRLTTKGEDAMFVLLAFLRYGVRYHLSQAGNVTRPSVAELLNQLPSRLKSKRQATEVPIGPNQSDWILHGSGRSKEV